MKTAGLFLLISALAVGVLIMTMPSLRRKATLLRIFGPSKKRQPEQCDNIDFTVDHIQNKHDNCKGILATALFVGSGNEDRFEGKYLLPLLKFNETLRRNVGSFAKSWYYRVYIPQDFPEKAKTLLLNADIEVAVLKSKNHKYLGTLWRFLPLFGNDPFLCCDSDSNDYMAEWDKIEKWYQSNNTFFHRKVAVINSLWPVSAGSWGCKPKSLSSKVKSQLKTQLTELAKTCTDFGCDELYLKKFVYPLFFQYGVEKHKVYVWVEVVFILVIALVVLTTLKQRTYRST